MSTPISLQAVDQSRQFCQAPDPNVGLAGAPPLPAAYVVVVHHAAVVSQRRRSC